LVEAALESPNPQHRKLAIRVLGGWKKDDWPEGAEKAVRSALAAESDTAVKTHIAKMLEGWAPHSE